MDGMDKTAQLEFDSVVNRQLVKLDKARYNMVNISLSSISDRNAAAYSLHHPVCLLACHVYITQR